MSKNQSLSQNWSRHADVLQFRTGDDILVGNNQPIGSPTIDQTKIGIDYPTVQGAIDDLKSLTILPIDAILTNANGISPQGVSQVDEYKFSGFVRVEGKNVGDVVKFDCFGFYTDVMVGDTGDEVATKVKTTIESLITKNMVYSTVSTGGTLNILQVKYLDVQNHDLGSVTKNGITIDVSKLSPAKYGYGVWTRIGTQTITLDGSTDPTTLYYFRRDN